MKLIALTKMVQVISWRVQNTGVVLLITCLAAAIILMYVGNRVAIVGQLNAHFSPIEEEGNNESDDSIF